MFIYIFDDGSIAQHEESPTAHDLMLIGDGSLDVICIDEDGDSFLVNDENDLVEIPEARVEESSEGDEYHCPNSPPENNHAY